MSCRSVARSAIKPPSEVNSSTNWATAPSSASSNDVPLLMRDSTAWRRPLSRASPALAMSTSVAVPEALPALAMNPSATATTAASYAARLSPGSAGPLVANAAMATAETSCVTVTVGP